MPGDQSVYKKSFFHIVSVAIIAFILIACGENGKKGIDRKLNYSGTEEEFGESYGKAMVEATPEQQNILRERMIEIIQMVFSLSKNSNPMLVDAFVAKKNAEEFERIGKMSVRELFVWYLGEQQNTLKNIIPVIEKFQNGNTLKIESISITDINPKDLTPNTESLEVEGLLSLRNTSDSFNYDFRGCHLDLSLDGKLIEEFRDVDDCNDFKTIKSQGEKETFKFRHRILGNGNIIKFYDLLKDRQMKKIAWSFRPPKDSFIKSNTDERMLFSVGDYNLKAYKDELQKITADLAVMKGELSENKNTQIGTTEDADMVSEVTVPATTSIQEEPDQTNMVTQEPESEQKSYLAAPKTDTQQPSESSQTQQEKNELFRYKAKDALDEANKQINVVWKGTTKDIRSAILPEQREWLKQRENDCNLKASSEEPNDAIVQDTIRFNCMVAMTDLRTEVLKQKISTMPLN